MTIPVDPSVYTDFRGLAELRRRAGSDESGDSQDTLREVAQQFEAIFVNMMMKSMREASLADGLLDSEQIEQYQGMFDQQMALELTKGRGLGLADMLVRQLGGDVNPFVNQPPAVDVTPIRLPRQVDQPPAMESAASQESGKPQTRVSQDWAPASREQFIADLWPHAERAASALGTSPQVLLAQAALETGWGQHVMPRGNGRSSHNLFGIKADRQWEGGAAVVDTLEYEGGAMRKQQARFRAYESPAESFDDYARFLTQNPRYSQVLQNASDPDRYVHGLQEAGYATDPGYAAKIKRIMNSGIIQDTAEQAQRRTSNTVAQGRTADTGYHNRSAGSEGS